MPVLYKLYKLVRTFKDGHDNKKANNHWFARSVSVGDMSTDELAKNIKDIYLNYQPEYKINSSSRKRVVALLEDLRFRKQTTLANRRRELNAKTQRRKDKFLYYLLIENKKLCGSASLRSYNCFVCCLYA